MSRHNWSRLKKNCPIDAIPRSFFQDAKNAELKLSQLDVGKDTEHAKAELVEINEQVTSVVQDFQKNLNKVYEEADAYNEAAHSIYKLIDINLRFYRFSEIDSQFKKMDKNRGDPSMYRLQRALSNIRTLLNTIYDAIQYANDGFKPVEGIDDEIVYLVDLADHFEISIRYFAKYQSEQEEGNIDYFDELENNDMNEALENIEEDESDFVKESEDQMEDMLEGMEGGI